MEKRLAEEIRDCAISTDQYFDRILELVNKIDDEKVRKHYVESLSRISSIIYFDVLRPLQREFNDIDIGDR
jgi:hypothetical protein